MGGFQTALHKCSYASTIKPKLRPKLTTRDATNFFTLATKLTDFRFFIWLSFSVLSSISPFADSTKDDFVKLTGSRGSQAPSFFWVDIVVGGSHDGTVKALQCIKSTCNYLTLLWILKQDNFNDFSWRLKCLTGLVICFYTFPVWRRPFYLAAPYSEPRNIKKSPIEKSCKTQLCPNSST